MRDISGKRRVFVALITFALAGGVAAQAVLIDSRTNARPDSGDLRGMGQPRAAKANGLALAGAATTPKDKCETLIECDEDLAAAVELETMMADSLQQGHVVPITFGSTQTVPGDVVGTEGWGDSGLWTGTYVAAQAMRYAVAKSHLQGKGNSAGKGNSDNAPGHAELTFWTAQRDQALSRLKTILAAEHRDINIAEDWTGSLKVPPDVNTVDPIGQRHAANFGGGIIKGERGMIMRSCTPVGLGVMGINDPTVDAANPVNNNNNRVFTITSTVDDVAYNCETSPSRDTYAGLTFGLLTAYDLLVGPDHRELRDQIRDDLLSMGNFLVKYGWNFPRPHGYVSADHDFDGAISPLMVYVPMARLNMVQAVRHVLKDGGTPADRQKWDRVWAEELASQGPILAFSMEVDAADAGHSGYYKYNLHHLNAFNITRLENDPTVRTLFKQAIGVMDRTTGDDINAHFETITYALTGEPTRLSDALTHLDDWRDYRAKIDLGGGTCNGLRIGLDLDGKEIEICDDKPTQCPDPDLECVPQDQMEISQSTPAGQSDAMCNEIQQGVCVVPGFSVIQSLFPGQPKPKVRSRYPLPVALRPPTDFLWQRPSTQLNGSISASHRYPGVDYLLPYWMIRYYTEVEKPGSGSFPEWAGPAHV